MKKYLVLIQLLFPLLFLCQAKETKNSERLEIVGKWNSCSSMDSTKKEVVEFLPDGSFIEYKNGNAKHSKTKYVLYDDELTMKVKEKEEIVVRFKVKKESYGLYLTIIDINKKPDNNVLWVKLFPCNP